MKKGIILTLPKYDLVTQYLSAFSGQIEMAAEGKSIFLKRLNEKEVNRKEFEKVVKKLDCKMIVLNGHGNEDNIAGDNDEIIVSKEENPEILRDRITYARSCEAASGLGEKFAKDQKTCFIGYDLPFEFYFDDEWVTNPIKDNTARLFLESSNLVPLSLIKGNNSSESHERAKKQMLKNIKKVLRNQTKESFAVAESLWNNYVGQRLHGNKTYKL